MFDVVALGETMIRLTPLQHRRLEQAETLEAHIGGSESNMLVGLARLGLKPAWVSRLTDNPLGHHIGNLLRGLGVDISNVVWTPEDRVGLFFLEEGAPPRGSRVYYDRRHSAMARMQPGDLPTSLFTPGSAQMFHTSGITLAIAPDAAATARSAVSLARGAGWKISFDFNYRANLWSPGEAHQGCTSVADEADLIFIPLRDYRNLFPESAAHSADDALAALHERFPQATVVVTLSADGAAVIDPAGQVYRAAAYPAQPMNVGRIGVGDAFVAGFLYGYLTQDIPAALAWGNAAAAQKFTIPGDLPVFDAKAVADLIAGSGRTDVKR